MALKLKKDALQKHLAREEVPKIHTILLVDDERENLSSLGLVLEKEYNLLFANDGQEALELIEQHDNADEIHMIISDQMMPRLTGVQLFEKTATLLPDTIRIILTGFTDADAIISSINEGQIYKFLTKPINPDDLRVTVQRSLEYFSLKRKNLGLVINLKNRVTEVENMANVFRKFVPRQFIERVSSEGIENIEDMGLGIAQSDTVTLLFADIRSFTSISEKLQPQEVLNYLNDCFSCISEPVHKNAGFVDKYVGDAIIALFDTEDASSEGQVDNAIRAAIEMQKALKSFSKKRQAEGLPATELGIGIHTGPVIIGTVGVEQRMDLTVLGDTVNVAARLEALTKDYQASIIISSQSRQLLQESDDYLLRELDCLRVKGRAEPLVIYEVMIFDTDQKKADYQQLLSRYNQALQHFYEKDWKTARSIFQECMETHPSDAASRIYHERCETLIRTTDDSLGEYRNDLLNA